MVQKAVTAVTRLIVIIVALGFIAPASASAAAEFPGYPEKSYSFPYFGTPSGKIVCEYRSKCVTCTNFTVSNLRQRTWYAGTKGHAHYQTIGGNFPT